MKTLALLCAGLALFGLILSAILWRDLHAQRELMAEWQRSYPGAASTDQSQLIRSTPPSTTLPQPHAGAAQAEALDVFPASPRETPTISAQLANERERLQDPEYRRYALARFRQMAPENHPGLADTLKLSVNQANALFDLLAEQQLELTSMLVTSAGNGPGDPDASRETARRRQEMQRRHDTSLTSLLGDARYQKWQEYQDTRRAQQQIEGQYEPAMRTLGQPLNEAQVKALSSVLLAEQKRQRQEVQNVRSTAPRQRPATVQQLREEIARRQSESNGRIVAAARPSLSAQQLESLRATLDQQVIVLRGAIQPQ